MESAVLYLIKVGEIALKGENRGYFEAKLRQNIKRQLREIDCTIRGGNGRFFLSAHERDEAAVREVLATTFGVIGFSCTLRAAKRMEEIRAAALELVGRLEPSLRRGSFKVASRRSDKSFELTSYEIDCAIGKLVQESFDGLRVDVHNPDWVLHIEVRDRAFLYVDSSQGPGGLPVGCAGRGVLLLSGGIDSPVAGYLMAKRGLRLDAVYFHTYPYTSNEALAKVTSLSEILAPYLGGVNLFVVPFTDCQLRIKERAVDEEVTLLMRACMMRIADALAREREATSLVTGESLGQVASQTQESIHFTGSVTELPVLRPLIGFDKEEIIALARRIGTFETSILPYDDCCTIFSPKHPLIRPDLKRMKESFARLEIEPLLGAALNQAERSFIRPCRKATV